MTPNSTLAHWILASVRRNGRFGTATVLAIAMVAPIVSSCEHFAFASPVELDVAFLARSPLGAGPDITYTVVQKEEEGTYPTMVNKSVHLERGVDPATGPIPANSPNYFTSLDATALERGFRIQNRMSLSRITPGTFARPSDPNFFRLSRTDYTGYVGGGITDRLVITGGTGKGYLNMSFRIHGSGLVSGPFGTSAGATVCPMALGASGCSPMGVRAQN